MTYDAALDWAQRCRIGHDHLAQVNILRLESRMMGDYLVRFGEDFSRRMLNFSLNFYYL